MSYLVIIKWIKIILVLYVVIGVVLYFTQTLILFQGKRLAANYRYNFAGQPITEHTITRANGTTLHYIIFAPTNGNASPKGTMVYYHGNIGNINRYAPYLTLFTNAGYQVYIMDYPGFGKSTGTITETGLKEDAQVVYNIAVASELSIRKIDVPENSIADSSYTPSKGVIIYGKSMGTGLATYIAAHNNCPQVILETPYYSLPTVYDDFTWIYPTKLMLRYQMNNYEQLPLIKAPITILHGTHDKLISIANASRLKPLLKPTTDTFVTIDGGAHNNLYSFETYQALVKSKL